MSSIERLIVQNIERKKVRESIHNTKPVITTNINVSDLDREVEDMLELYSLMLSKEYDLASEGTSMKRSLRVIEDRLIELKVDGIKKSPVINIPKLPGEFLTTQEKTILPESRRRIKEENLMNGNVIFGTINNDIVKTKYGDRYKVSKIDIGWLKAQGKMGRLDIRDIKAVGTLIY